MSLMQKKYKKLVKELVYVNSEYEYVKEAVKEAHYEFEKQYREYCAENEVPIDELNNKNKDKLQKVFPKAKQEVDEEGIVKSKNTHSQKEPADKILQKMYRTVATKIHPDKFSTFEQTPEIIEKTEMFKECTTAYNERNWGKFLDICDKLDILPNRYKRVTEIIQIEIDKLNIAITNEKSTFSWRLFECEEDEPCREGIFKNFLFQLFKYKV